MVQYELTLVATDSVNEATTKVVILIADVNDRPPEFDRPTYEATIEEERADGLPIPIIKVELFIILPLALSLREERTEACEAFLLRCFHLLKDK